jgi:probable HAF family extracellular repeat protein
MPRHYTIIDLGTLPAGTTSTAASINDKGQVVGYSQVAGGNNHAFLWDPKTGLQDLGTLLGGANSGASGNSICSSVAGRSDFAGSAGNTHAFLWAQAGGFQDLCALPGDNSSAAIASLTPLRPVVGNSVLTAAGSHAFVRTTEDGMRDLNSLIPTNSGWELQGAVAINVLDRLWRSHGFLLTPQCEC